MTNALLAASASFILFGFSGLGFLLGKQRPVSRPELGRRGRNRRQALRERAAFRFLEVPLRHVSVWTRPLMGRRCAGRLEATLSQAGFPLGLTVDELAAVSAVMSSLGLFMVLVVQRPVSPAVVSLVVIAAAWLPFARVEALARRRGKRITRRLPAVLELIVMCMSAGLDLPRALRCVVESATDSRDPIVEELDMVIQELELGLTRREALLGLADRVRTPEVRELVNSIVQSEQKGVSLTKTLTIQSRTLKLGRSMSAEQAASGAALMLVGPMSLIFLCVIALLLGPVLLRTMSGGFDL